MGTAGRGARDSGLKSPRPGGRVRRRPAVPVPCSTMGSVIKKRRKRMAKKKHRKLLKRTRVQRRNKK